MKIQLRMNPQTQKIAAFFTFVLLIIYIITRMNSRGIDSIGKSLRPSDMPEMDEDLSQRFKEVFFNVSLN